MLKPPSAAVWINLTYFQRALWYVDELEARWSNFLVANPEAKYVQVSWSSEQSQEYGTMSRVHRYVADALGLVPAEETHAVKQHVKSKAKDPKMRARFEAQDREYQLRMQYTPQQKRMIERVQF